MMEITLVALIISSVIGLLCGITFGMLPGLGVSSSFLLITPILVAFHPVYGLFLFVSFLITSQYFGSITALIYGVPGEITSFPVIAERKHLLSVLHNVLFQTAVGSLLASLAAMAMFVILMSLNNVWLYLYNYRVFAWILALAVIGTVCFGSSTNTIWHNIILFALGLTLAKIGFNSGTGQVWGTFGWSGLASGVPLSALALGLLIIPNLVQPFIITKSDSQDASNGTVRVYWFSMARGTVMGIIGGLVPGVTYLASTQLSYFVENFLNRKAADRPIKSVVASSSADNAGSVSSLYPLLCVGIPISLGEAMVVWLFDRHNLPLSWTTLTQTVQGVPLHWLLLACGVGVNLAAYSLSWPGRSIAIALARNLLTKTTRYVTIIIMVIGTILLSHQAPSAETFWLCLISSLVIALRFKQCDWMPLVMAFILYDSIELTLLKLGILSI